MAEGKAIARAAEKAGAGIIKDMAEPLLKEAEQIGEKAAADEARQAAKTVVKDVAGGPSAEAAQAVRSKVADMKANMTKGELGRTTYTAAHVTTAEGNPEMWVAGAGKRGYVPPAIRGDAINVRAPAPNELSGLEHINDGEMHLHRAAQQHGATINALGATRPVCGWCQDRLPADIPIVTPLKKRT